MIGWLFDGVFTVIDIAVGAAGLLLIAALL